MLSSYLGLLNCLVQQMDDYTDSAFLVQHTLSEPIFCSATVSETCFARLMDFKITMSYTAIRHVCFKSLRAQLPAPGYLLGGKHNT